MIKTFLATLVLSLFPFLSHPSPTPTPSPQPITLLFAGDLMLDRHIRQKAQSSGYDFILEPLTNLFSQQDLVIANLEGPVTDNNSISLGSEIGSPRNYVFTFSPDSLATLTKNKIHLVNLGNNHILNFGNKGLTTTLSYLDQNQIAYFGQPEAAQNYRILEFQGKKISIISYNQFISGGLAQTLTNLNQTLNQSDWQIIYAHWDNEYAPQSSPATQKLAHQFIDAGADLVIGSHPHVVQQTEIYQGKTVYYSLGNFVFDQYFSKETQTGLLVQVKIDPISGNFSFADYQIKMDLSGQTQLSSKVDANN